MTALTWCAISAMCLTAADTGPWRPRMHRLATAGRLVSRRGVSTVGSGRDLQPAGVVAACLLVGGVLLAEGPLLGVAVSVGMATGAAIWRQAARRRVNRSAQTRRADATAIAVAALRAGSRPEQALHAAARVDPAGGWSAAAHALERDGDPAEILLAAPGLDGVGHAWRLATQTGAPLADVLDRIASDQAATLAHSRSLRAVLAGAHASAAVLAVLPCVGIALGSAMGLHPVRTLLHTGAGHLLCCAGAVLEAGGVLWTMRIVARASPC